MDESPVINESEEFIPLEPAEALPDGELPPGGAPGGDSNVLEPGDEFVPMRPPAAPSVPSDIRMPTPGQVLRLSPEDKRLDTVPFEFADIRALAQRILKRAQEQGQAKLDAARKQVASMEKAASDKAYKEAFPKGQKEGFAKGEKDGMATAQKQIDDAIAAEKAALQKNAAPVGGTLKAIAEAYDAARQQLIAQAEGDLLMLALDMAKRLVGHELSVDPDAIKPLAVECIGLVTDRTSLTVRVNPEDKRVMEEYYPELKTIFPDLGPVRVLADPGVERGGIMAATREAEVDMRLATRLASFEEVILGFSGKDAVAPWNAIPDDAIAAAKAASAESPYSLWDDADEEEEEASKEASSAGANAPGPGAGGGIVDGSVGIDGTVEDAPAAPDAPDAPEGAAPSPDIQQVDDVAELARLVDELPPEG